MNMEAEALVKIVITRNNKSKETEITINVYGDITPGEIIGQLELLKFKMSKRIVNNDKNKKDLKKS